MSSTNKSKKKRGAKKKIANVPQLPDDASKIEPIQMKVQSKPEPGTPQTKNKIKDEPNSMQPVNATRDISATEKAILQMSFSGKLWTPKDFEIAYAALLEQK